MKRYRLTESKLRGIIREAVKNALTENNKRYKMLKDGDEVYGGVEKIFPNKIYIVFDGTSYYDVMGYDLEDEIEYNDVEVVRGPFDAPMHGMLEDLIDSLNAEASGRQYDTRYLGR